MRLFAFASCFLALAAEAPRPEDQVAEAMRLLESRHPTGMDLDRLARGALSGLMNELDQSLGVSGNAALSPIEARERQAAMEGHRVGMAIEFVLASGQGLVVTDVFPGGPADRAGLVPGDLIVAVDDQPLTGLAPNAVHSLIQRPRSDKVVLDVRGSDRRLRRVTVGRAAWRLDRVRVDQQEDHTFIRIPYFGKGVGQSLSRALTENPDSALILDLRSNSGGMLEEALAAADLFLEGGAVFAIRFKPGQSQSPLYCPGPGRHKGPVVLLVDSGTSGVAEAFAASLQSNGVAKLVGTPTAGDAGLPSFVPLNENTVLYLVDQLLLRPDGSSWAHNGLKPDLLAGSVEVMLPSAPGELPPDLQREAARRLVGP